MNPDKIEKILLVLALLSFAVLVGAVILRPLRSGESLSIGTAVSTGVFVGLTFGLFVAFTVVTCLRDPTAEEIEDTKKWLDEHTKKKEVPNQ
jgi:uncharacterized membrane protein